jgi:ChrR Cupin-like domain
VVPEEVTDQADVRLCDLAELHALGSLDASESAAFEAHLAGGCAACACETADYGQLLSHLALAEVRPADGNLREELLELAAAPTLPLSEGDWIEAAPGVKLRVCKEDKQRDLLACLLWAQPGARHPQHRHVGREVILVLKGRIFDGHESYGVGEICRSRPGSEHFEEAMAGEDCICYVLSYGGVVPLAAH